MKDKISSACEPLKLCSLDILEESIIPSDNDEIEEEAQGTSSETNEDEEEVLQQAEGERLLENSEEGDKEIKALDVNSQNKYEYVDDDEDDNSGAFRPRRSEATLRAHYDAVLNACNNQSNQSTQTEADGTNELEFITEFKKLSYQHGGTVAAICLAGMIFCFYLVIDGLHG